MTYAEKLKHPKWQRRRLEVMQRDNFKCIYCGSEERTLHVHHIFYTKDPWDAPGEHLQTLCDFCHYFIEKLKKKDINILSLHCINGVFISLCSKLMVHLYFSKNELYVIDFNIFIENKSLWDDLINYIKNYKHGEEAEAGN